jgi:hypothetical protein
MVFLLINEINYHIVFGLIYEGRDMKKIIDSFFVVASFVIVALSFVFAGGMPFDPTEDDSIK